MQKSMSKSIVVAAHDLGGHLSVDKTISKITQDFVLHTKVLHKDVYGEPDD